MKLLARIAIFALLGGHVAVAQTATTFAPGQSILASGINSAFATKRDSAAGIAAENAAQNTANGAASGLTSINNALNAIAAPNNILKFANLSGQPLVQITQPLNFANSSTPTALAELLDIRVDDSTETASTITQGVAVNLTNGPNSTGSQTGIYTQVNGNSTQGGSNQILGQWIQVNKGANSQDAAWTILGQMRDQTGLNSAAEGAGGILSQEWDMSASNADDKTNPAHWWGKGYRAGTEWVFGINQQASTIASNVEFGSGLFFTQNNSNTTVDSVIDFGAGGGGGDVGFQTYNVLDAMNTVPPAGDASPVNVVLMPRGEEIEFAGDLKGGSLASAPQRALSYNITDTALEYFINGVGVAFSVLDSGMVKANYGLTVTGKFIAPFATPASSSAACTQGQQEADASYEYVCVATNTWKRAALSSF